MNQKTHCKKSRIYFSCIKKYNNFNIKKNKK